MADFFGIPFDLTKDSLCRGTGKIGEFYCYIIVAWNAEVIELDSKQNDSMFSYYSKWLLSTSREYRKEGRSIIFPMKRK